MPKFALSPSAKLFYRDESFADPWVTPEPILMMHGFGESSLAWNSWMPTMSRHFRVIRPDMRGFGKSTPMPEDHAWSVDEVVDDYCRLMDHLGIERFHLLSAKVGGIMSLRFAASKPDRVRTLVVNSGGRLFGRDVFGGPDARAKLVAQIKSEGSLAGVARDSMGSRLGPDSTPAELEGWTQLMAATPPSTAIGFVGTMVPSIDVREDLKNIKCPTLLITTEHSPMNPPSDLEPWLETIPNAELFVMPGASYHPAATNYEEASRAALDFLAKQGAKI